MVKDMMTPLTLKSSTLEESDISESESINSDTVISELTQIIILIDSLSKDQKHSLKMRLKTLLGHRNKITSALQFNQLKTVIQLLSKCDEIFEGLHVEDYEKDK